MKGGGQTIGRCGGCSSATLAETLVLAEAGVGWIPFFAQEFDYYQMSFGHRPSDSGGQRDIRGRPASTSIDRSTGRSIQDTVGCKRFPEFGATRSMWSNDYPHSACIWPGATRFIAQDLGHLAPEPGPRCCAATRRLYNDGKLPPPADTPGERDDLEAWNKVHWQRRPIEKFCRRAILVQLSGGWVWIGAYCSFV